MKWKEFVPVLLLGILLPLMMFLIAENWHGPADSPTVPTTAQTATQQTQPEETVMQP